jgi:hypothetical protein
MRREIVASEANITLSGIKPFFCFLHCITFRHKLVLCEYDGRLRKSGAGVSNCYTSHSLRIMRAVSNDQLILTAQGLRVPVDQSTRHARSRWTRSLSGGTRRLTQSERGSLAWRIIAGGTRPGEAHSLLRAWPGWEQIARLLWPVSQIPGAPNNLLCIRITAYRGATLVLPDVTTIAPRAILGELHCNNREILELVRRGSNPFAACRQDLKALANWVAQDATAGQIEAFYACTILAKAADRLGFTVLPKPATLRLRLEKFFFKGLLLLYSLEGLRRIQHGSTANGYPAEVWLSRRELLRLYYERRASAPG